MREANVVWIAREIVEALNDRAEAGLGAQLADAIAFFAAQHIHQQQRFTNDVFIKETLEGECLVHGIKPET
jgi:hypothetical protein